MNSLLAIREEYDAAISNSIEAGVKLSKAREETLKADMALSEIFEKSIILNEIYLNAQEQFGRIRRTPSAALTAEDIAELEKWIGRAKSLDGLKAIRVALMELKRFRPIDIRKNLYALVQKIIIEGPHKQHVTTGVQF